MTDDISGPEQVAWVPETRIRTWGAACRRGSHRGGAWSGVARPFRTALAVSALSLAALAGCGGDDDEGASAASLKRQLLPVSEWSGLKVERTFEWDNPIDAVHEGLPTPEGTPLSRSVEVFEDAGFEAGAGERLVAARGEPFHGPQVTVDVIQLGSEEGAGDALEYVSKEALKQPCFAVCSVGAEEISVPGIPGAKGSHLTPLPEPPEGAPPPFEAYGVGFTIGSRLFVVNAGAEPGQVGKQQVMDAAAALYERNAGDGAGA